MKKESKNKDIVIITFAIITFLIVAGISLSAINGMRINDGDVRSILDLKCYWTVDQTADVNVTWYRNSTQNLTATVSCTSGVECHTSVGSGTVPSSYTTKGDLWTCSVSFWNGTDIESKNTSVTIQNTPPTTPEVYWSNGTRIVNTTAIMSEDNTTYLDINSTDEDNDTITYSINDSTFCNVNSASGELSCTPSTESHLGPRIIQLTASDSGGAIFDFLTINVTPTNDAPRFSPLLTTKNLTEGEKFNYVITVEDDENNFPLNMSIINITMSPLNNTVDLNITLTRISNTTFVLVLGNNRTATVSEASNNYTVNLILNDTDTITNNSKSTISLFQLIGMSFNHLPNISYINNSGIQGGDISIYVNATDIDNQTLTFLVTNPLYNAEYYNSTTDYNMTVPNASFVDGWVNVTGLTNDHVINHSFTLYVLDGIGNNTKLIDIFISNTNDAPIIHETSNYTTNTLNNMNMSQMIAYIGVPFRFKVNASDIDDRTYDRQNTGLGTYTTNDSVSFPINSSTGVISFTPMEIGNFTFTVTVMDNGSLTYNRTANIEIFNNTNPVFTVEPITIYCYEYDETNSLPQYHNCSYLISANVSEVDGGDAIDSYWTNSSMFQINSTTGLINFTANQTNIGNHSILLSVNDTRGGINSTIIYLIINNTNNPPVMQTPDVPMGKLLVGTIYQIVFRATDQDLSLDNSYENLTFSWNISGPNTSVFTFIQSNNTNAVLNIVPNGALYEGNYTLNVSVSDSYGNVSYELSLPSIYLYNATPPPDISSVIPSGTPNTETINNDTWRDTADFPGMTTTITIFENQTYLFNQTSSADNSTYENSLTYAWYYDGIQVATTQHYQKYFDFFSNGSHNLTIVVSDEYGSSTAFDWIINVTNVNRPPIYNPRSLENRSVSGSTTLDGYLTYSLGRFRFYDPDDNPQDFDDNLQDREYSFDNETSLVFSSSLCSYANFSFEDQKLTIHAYQIGECYIMITAVDAIDGSLYVRSESVLINITNITESNQPVEVPINTESTGGGTNTRPLPIPLPEEVEKPKPLQILTPKLVTTYKNATIKIPITINNTWNDTLVGITLEAETNSSNVTLYLDKIYIPKLNKGESTEATLYAHNYKSEGHYEIRITANVSIPAYRDVATIFINSAEMRSEGEELENKISFAQDLLSSNPECQELNELLNQAKLELDNNNYASTAKIVDTVLNGCKYLVNNARQNQEAPDRDFIKTFEWKKAYGDYMIIGIFGVLFLMSVYYILKKDNPEQEF
ncbi:MAG: hypothetical protein ACP5NW_00225 [Candidatus Woesearchaeota archaeon]